MSFEQLVLSPAAKGRASLAIFTDLMMIGLVDNESATLSLRTCREIVRDAREHARSTASQRSENVTTSATRANFAKPVHAECARRNEDRIANKLEGDDYSDLKPLPAFGIRLPLGSELTCESFTRSKSCEVFIRMYILISEKTAAYVADRWITPQCHKMQF
jgi:hypothetical protein